MRPFIFLALRLVSVLWVGCALIASAQDWSIRQLVVAYLRISRPDRPDDTAAGIYVGSNEQNAYFVTAYHALKKDDNGPVSAVGVQFKNYPETIIAEVLPIYDPELDLGVFRVLVRSVPANTPKLTVREPSSTLAIHIIGHPPGGPWSVWDGTIENVNGPSGDSHHFTTNTDRSLVGGYSGGPVFDSAGALVGMHVSGSSSYALALKSGDIIRQLSAWNVPHNNLSDQKIVVSVAPTNPPSMHFGEKQTFTSSVTGTDVTSVSWSASKGRINASGSFTAPNESGEVTITATSTADRSKSASVNVKVIPQQLSCVLTVHGLQRGWNLDVKWSVDGDKQPNLKAQGGGDASSKFVCDSGDHTIAVELTATIAGYHQLGGSKPKQSCDYSFTVDKKAARIVVDPQNGENECNISTE